MGHFPILIMLSNMRCLVASHDICGEGVVWHPQLNAVFWTDINRGQLHRYSLQSETLESWKFDQPLTAVVLTTDVNLLLLVLGGRILIWDIWKQEVRGVLFRLPSWPEERCNDARVDPNGVLWFGTMQNNVLEDQSTKPIDRYVGCLYSISADGDVKLWDSGFGITNTVAWSPQGEWMYFGDTLQNCVYRYEFDPVTSKPGNRVSFFEGFARGLPDGSTVDAEGYLWNCRYGGACIVRVTPQGEVAGVFNVPVKNPTTCTFGLADRQTLFFTSAGEAETKPESDEGNLFSFDAQVSGLSDWLFRL